MAHADYRPAQPADWPVIEAMCLALYAADVVGEPMDRGKIRRSLRGLAEHPDRGQVVVAEADGCVAGYAIVIWFWSNEYGGLLAVVDELWVEPGQRGRGVASGLFAWLRRQYPELVGLDLEVSPENDQALGWYQRRGFVPIRNQMLRWLPRDSNDPDQGSAE